MSILVPQRRQDAAAHGEVQVLRDKERRQDERGLELPFPAPLAIQPHGIMPRHLISTGGIIPALLRCFRLGIRFRHSWFWSVFPMSDLPLSPPRRRTPVVPAEMPSTSGLMTLATRVVVVAALALLRRIRLGRGAAVLLLGLGVVNFMSFTSP